MSTILDSWAGVVLRFLLVGSSTAVIAVPLAWLLLRTARIRTPVYRHLIWLYCVASFIALPPLWIGAPKLTLAVLPARAETPLVKTVPPTGLGESAAPSQGPPREPALSEPFGQISASEDNSRTPLSYKTTLAGLWFLGVCLMAARLGVGWSRLRRICLQASPVPGFSDHARASLRLTSDISSPACFGLWRPVILLPQPVYDAASKDDLRMILTHEYAHIQRWDGWINLWQRIVEAVFFFHPLVWLASRQLTNEREQICDNYVLAGGASADDYTTLLFHLVEHAFGQRPLPAVALFEGQLLSRVRRLLEPLCNRRTCLPRKVAVLGGAVAIGVLLVFGSIRLAAKAAETGGAVLEPAQPTAAPTVQTAPVGQKAAGPRPATIRDVKPPFTFTLTATAPNGKPQPGVTIQCRHPRSERGRTLTDMTAKTDTSGTAQFVVRDANLITDRYIWFSVIGQDFAGTGPVGISPLDHEFTWTFQTLPLQERIVRVVDPEGKGVAGARLWLHCPPVFLDDAGYRADSDGRIVLRCPPGRLTAAAVAPGFASTVLYEVEFPAESPYMVHLDPGHQIQGRILDAQDRPVENVLVQARKEEPFHYLDEFILRAHSDKDGRFTIAHVSAGDWRISAKSEDPNRLLFVAPVTYAVGTRADVRGVALEAREGFRIKGRYVTKYNTRLVRLGGRHLLGILVDSPLHASWQEQTREDGTFDIWGLPCHATGFVDFVGVSGFHEVIRMTQPQPFFRVNDRNLRFENVPPGTYEGIEVQFLLAGRVDGTVTDAAGVSLRDVEVIVRPPGHIYRCDDQGRFTGEVPPGTAVTLTVRKRLEEGGRAKARSLRGEEVLLVTEPFTVQEGQIVEKHLAVAFTTRRDPPAALPQRPAPLAALDTDVKPDTLAGKKVLVCFFDMDQRPSRRFVQELAAQAKQLEQNALPVLLIHAGAAEKSTVQQWLRESGVPFAAGVTAATMPTLQQDWTVQALPWLVLLDESRIIRATGFDLEQLDGSLKNQSLDRLGSR